MPRKKGIQRKLMSIYMSEYEKDKIVKRAEKEGKSLADLIRFAVLNYIEIKEREEHNHRR